MNKTLKWLGGGIAAAMLLGLAGLFSGEVAEAQPTGPPHRFAGSVTLDGAPAAAGTSVTATVGYTECGSATVITGANGSTYALDVPDDCADAGDDIHFYVGGVEADQHAEWASGGRTDLDLTATTPMDDMGGMDDECPDESMDNMDDGMGDEDTGDDMPSEPSEPSEPAEPMEPSEPSEPMEDGMDDGMDDGMADDCPTEDDMGDMDDPEEPSEPDTGMDDTGMDDTGMDDEMAPEVADTGTGLASTSNTTSLAAILGVMALAITLGGYTFARRRR